VREWATVTVAFAASSNAAVGRPTIGTAVKVAGRMKIYGKERVPMAGGLVIACNHLSDLDPLVVAGALGHARLQASLPCR